MAKPLDTQSKISGLITPPELYFMIAFTGLSAVSMPSLFNLIGIIPTFIFLGGINLSTLGFLVVSNQCPQHFFLNMFMYRFKSQKFIPVQKKGQVKN